MTGQVSGSLTFENKEMNEGGVQPSPDEKQKQITYIVGQYRTIQARSMFGAVLCHFVRGFSVHVENRFVRFRSSRGRS